MCGASGLTLTDSQLTAHIVFSIATQEDNMLAYAMIGTNDKPKALAFYDAVLAEMGYGRAMDFGRSQAYGDGKGVMLAVGTPADDKAATVGNGCMMAINGKTEEQITAAYTKAIALGGKDEGAPGQRGPGFYGAYFRDLDGNKICLCKF
jgi:catechol 2,3-dioxygenase-like lactoylglutathione lyase family enzyme